MSQEFNLRYDDIQPESNANDNTPLEQPECVTYYETEGHARNVCFVLENGDRIFLNYAYLISGEYEHESGGIKLLFTSHIVLIQGIDMANLFDAFSSQFPMRLICSSGRYEILTTSGQLKISFIKISPNGLDLNGSKEK